MCLCAGAGNSGDPQSRRRRSSDRDPAGGKNRGWRTPVGAIEIPGLP